MNKDYIMRMIEEFFKALAVIIMKRETKQYADAKTDLDGLSQKVTGFSLEHLKSLGAEGIKYVFSKDNDTENEKIYLAARMLKEEGMILESEGNIENSLKSFSIAKELFELVSDSDFPERDQAMKELEELRINK
jgi:hypothetical protein